MQDGARRHYVVPVALHRAGALRLMFCEWFLKRGFVAALFRCLVRPFAGTHIRAMVERRCDEIPSHLVHINPYLVLRQQWARRRHECSEAFYEWSSRAVGKWILRRGMGDANVLYGFIRNVDPRLCQFCHDRGILTVGDQIIAPAAVEAEEARRQSARWPDWEMAARQPNFALVEEVERNTWQHLDRITCGSEYVRQGLLQQGIGADRIAVNPNPINSSQYIAPMRLGRRGPITVGFVGGVGLRKGAPYFLQVARHLAGKNMRFVMVGPVQAPDSVITPFTDCVQFAGRVPRGEIVDWMNRFDIFLFPSTCEGSAGAVREAMACGLPIVASPNSGTLVRDGVDGFIRAYDDVEAMAACIEQLAVDEQLRVEMGILGRRQTEAVTVESYGRALVELMISALSS